MRRAEPLVVDVFVAALAGVGLHEELAGNFLVAVNLRGTGKERSFRSVALAIHRVRRHAGILNAVATLPAFADVARPVADASEHAQAQPNTDRAGEQSRADRTRFRPNASTPPASQQEPHSCDRKQDVKIQLVPFGPECAGLYQDEAEHGTHS